MSGGQALITLARWHNHSSRDDEYCTNVSCDTAAMEEMRGASNLSYLYQREVKR